jgi:AcrR family transcriptional regulator
VRTRGWQGDLPSDEAEARARILDAAKRCVDRYGPVKTTLADVAAEVGVTRQTVYRHFSSVSDMLMAVAKSGTEDFLRRMQADLPSVATPTQAVTETIIYCLHALPTEPYLGLLLRTGQTELLTCGATSSKAVALGAEMLRRFPIDWAAHGFTPADVERLAEVVMRLFLSFLQYPADPPRTDDELRQLITIWTRLAP